MWQQHVGLVGGGHQEDRAQGGQPQQVPQQDGEPEVAEIRPRHMQGPEHEGATGLGCQHAEAVNAHEEREEGALGTRRAELGAQDHHRHQPDTADHPGDGLLHDDEDGVWHTYQEVPSEHECEVKEAGDAMQELSEEEDAPEGVVLEALVVDQDAHHGCDCTDGMHHSDKFLHGHRESQRFHAPTLVLVTIVFTIHRELLGCSLVVAGRNVLVCLTTVSSELLILVSHRCLSCWTHFFHNSQGNILIMLQLTRKYTRYANFSVVLTLNLQLSLE